MMPIVESNQYLMSEVFSRENVSSECLFETTDEPVTKDGVNCYTRMFQARMPKELYDNMSELEVVEYLYEHACHPDMMQYETKKVHAVHSISYMSQDDPFESMDGVGEPYVFCKVKLRYAVK